MNYVADGDNGGSGRSDEQQQQLARGIMQTLTLSPKSFPRKLIRVIAPEEAAAATLSEVSRASNTRESTLNESH